MIYKHILPAPGQIPLGKLTQRDLQQFYTQMKTSRRLTRQELYGPGLSDRAIRGYHASYQAALGKATEALEHGMDVKNPLGGDRPRVGGHDPGHLHPRHEPDAGPGCGEDSPPDGRKACCLEPEEAISKNHD